MKVAILLGSGDTVAVEAEVFGAYAVHTQLDAGGTRIVLGWVVTHAASGLDVWKVFHREEAVKVAGWLAEHGPFPADSTAQELRDHPACQTLARTLNLLGTRWCARTHTPPR